MNKQELKAFLKQQSLHPLKQFGQNFLINRWTIQKIIHIVHKQAPPFVEIGPGPGALTRRFAGGKKDILLVERDKKIADYWKNKGYSVLTADALKLDWPRSFPKKCAIFGNLPYQIAGSFILKSSLHQKQISGMVLMMQKEVAKRAQAQPGSQNYGLLSVISQTFWFLSQKLLIPKTDFYPQPKVEGCLLEFQVKPKRADLDPSSFLKFVKACFALKRKKLLKKICRFGLEFSDVHPSEDCGNIDKKPKNLGQDRYSSSDGIKGAKIKKIFQDLNLSENHRAEELSAEQFIKLYFHIQKLY